MPLRSNALSSHSAQLRAPSFGFLLVPASEVVIPPRDGLGIDAALVVLPRVLLGELVAQMPAHGLDAVQTGAQGQKLGRRGGAQAMHFEALDADLAEVVADGARQGRGVLPGALPRAGEDVRADARHLRKMSKQRVRKLVPDWCPGLFLNETERTVLDVYPFEFDGVAAALPGKSQPIVRVNAVWRRSLNEAILHLFGPRLCLFSHFVMFDRPEGRLGASASLEIGEAPRFVPDDVQQIKLLVSNRAAELSRNAGGIDIDRFLIEVDEQAGGQPCARQLKRLAVVVFRTLGIADWAGLGELIRVEQRIDEAPDGAGTVFDVRAGLLEIAWPAIVRPAVAIVEAARISGLKFLRRCVEGERDESAVGVAEVQPFELAGFWVFAGVEVLTFFCRTCRGAGGWCSGVLHRFPPRMLRRVPGGPRQRNRPIFLASQRSLARPAPETSTERAPHRLQHGRVSYRVEGRQDDRPVSAGAAYLV